MILFEVGMLNWPEAAGPIGYIHSPFDELFGIPRQSGLAAAAQGYLEPIAPWDDPAAWQGIEAFSHLWLIWQFHAKAPMQAGKSKQVRPPRLGGNQRVGVFASRAPIRPNPIGLSLVRLEGVQYHQTGGAKRVKLKLSGLDLRDGTPVLDVKPYIPYADCPADSEAGWAAQPPERMPVVFAAALEQHPALDEAFKALIVQTLSLNPTPAYHQDTERRYGVCLQGWDVQFYCRADCIEVTGLVQP